MMRSKWLYFVSGIILGIALMSCYTIIKAKDKSTGNEKESWLKGKSYDMPAILAGLKKGGLDKSVPDAQGIEYLVKKGALPEVSDIWFCPVYSHVSVENGLSISTGQGGTYNRLDSGTLDLAVHYSRSPYYLQRKDGRIYVNSKMFPSMENFFVTDK